MLTEAIAGKRLLMEILSQQLLKKSTAKVDENCIAPTIQFAKLSKRQKWILALLKEHGCLNFNQICDYVKYLEQKDVKGDGVFPDTPAEVMRKRILSNIAYGLRMHTSESKKQSIYRSLRELIDRDLIARLEHAKPYIFTRVIPTGDGHFTLGFTHETGAFSTDHKLWRKSTWHSKSYRWGPRRTPQTMMAKELKRNTKYYEKLLWKVASKSCDFKIEAKKRGLLSPDGNTWVDE